ncbi:zinc finger protein PLAG1 isoform X3 [Syngnathoides biaculeatus]|uniref:zinc finger protein PLAG1 isoform X3 n=1 Tax=Syngnathoides biaculeatus TaxID=300417 RepID=UPI002ADD4F11|nr:zinc finger protein PLAG1 isoform X3 [Syngnathoides biaculeatus]
MLRTPKLDKVPTSAQFGKCAPIHVTGVSSGAMATGTQGHLDQGAENAKLAPPMGRRRRAEGKPKRNFPCQDCQKAFNSLEKLKVHSYSHTGERPYCCSQAGCTKAFVSKYKLLRHMATHSPEKTHKCSYCEKMFHRKDHLKNHLHIHDPYKEAFACQECGKSYNTKLGFKRHLALHAANSGDLTCQVCLQPFPSTGVLLEHLKSHAGKSSGGAKEKKHHCEHCERQFYTRKDVRRHMVVHTGRKDFLCQYCAQRFGRKDHLTRHVKKSHPQELLRVKTEPADSLEPIVYDLVSGGVKGELPDTLTTMQHQHNFYTGPILDSEPFPNAAHLLSLKYPLGSNITSCTVSSQEREQNLKGELESYLLELQSAMPSSSSAAPDPQLPICKLETGNRADMLEESSEERSLSKIATSVATAALASDSLASSSSLMDFSQFFNFLPLHGPLYNHAGAGEGQHTLTEENVHLHLPPEPSGGPEATQSPLESQASFICNLSTPTTLPRFHQAFQ